MATGDPSISSMYCNPHLTNQHMLCPSSFVKLATHCRVYTVDLQNITYLESGRKLKKQQWNLILQTSMWLCRQQWAQPVNLWTCVNLQCLARNLQCSWAGQVPYQPKLVPKSWFTQILMHARGGSECLYILISTIFCSCVKARLVLTWECSVWPICLRQL